MQYEELLDKAYEKLPKSQEASQRLEIPTPEILIQGNQTIIKNFNQICQALRREPKHVFKYLTKELASPGTFDSQRATFQTKISQSIIKDKIDNYVKEYVYCKECKRPDTKLIKEGRITIMKCEACGAKSAVRELK